MEAESAGDTTPAATAVRGARALFYFLIAELCLSLVSMLVARLSFAVGTALGTTAVNEFFKVQSVLWLVFDAALVVLLVPFVRGRRGSRSETVALAALALACVNLAFDLIVASPDLGGPELLSFTSRSFADRWFPVALFAVLVGFQVCFWLAITRSAARVPTAFGPVFYTLLGASAVFSLLRATLSPETQRELFVTGAFAAAIAWVRVILTAIRGVFPILVVRTLMLGRTGPIAASAEGELEAPPSGTRDIVIGALWLVGGLVVTLGSYSSASSSGGGRYVVTTGAIVIGVVRIVRGLLRSGQQRG